MNIGRFLAGVAALIWDPQTDKYLLMQRVDHRDFQAGAWECVTGRVDQGESYEMALHREVFEEIGASIQIEFIIGTTHFFRGERKTENELLGVIYGCTILNPEVIRIGSEHSNSHWLSPDEAYAFLAEGHWLQDVIRRAEQMRAKLPADLREAFRQEGFNIE